MSEYWPFEVPTETEHPVLAIVEHLSLDRRFHRCRVAREIMPKTQLGKWSLGLIAAMPVLFFIGMSFTNLLYESVPAGNSILEDIAGRPALAITMLAGNVSGISAFITGLIAIIRQKERALLVFVATVIGALLILFLIGEILFPH